jgi:predicted DNA-binding transcriptional regulator YafY
VSRSVNYTPAPFEATVKLHASAEDAAERLPPTAGSLEAIDGATCLLRSGAYSIDRLAVWLALIGFEFEVLEPLELADRVRDLAGRLSRAAPRKQ